jgi:hypothetical protein
MVPQSEIHLRVSPSKVVDMSLRTVGNENVIEQSSRSERFYTDACLELAQSDGIVKASWRQLFEDRKMLDSPA